MKLFGRRIFQACGVLFIVGVTFGWLNTVLPLLTDNYHDSERYNHFTGLITQGHQDYQRNRSGKRHYLDFTMEYSGSSKLFRLVASKDVLDRARLEIEKNHKTPHTVFFYKNKDTRPMAVALTRIDIDSNEVDVVSAKEVAILGWPVPVAIAFLNAILLAAFFRWLWRRHKASRLVSGANK